MLCGQEQNSSSGIFWQGPLKRFHFWLLLLNNFSVFFPSQLASHTLRLRGFSVSTGGCEERVTTWPLISYWDFTQAQGAAASSPRLSALPCTQLMQQKCFHGWLMKWFNCRVHLIIFRGWEFLLSRERKDLVLSGVHLERDSNMIRHLSRELSLCPVTFCFGKIHTCYDGICHIYECKRPMRNAGPPQ